jgi:hypothetical protein
MVVPIKRDGMEKLALELWYHMNCLSIDVINFPVYNTDFGTLVVRFWCVNATIYRRALQFM